jgi:hypothetical protein
MWLKASNPQALQHEAELRRAAARLRPAVVRADEEEPPLVRRHRMWPSCFVN